MEYLLDYAFIRPDGIPVLGITYHAPYVSGTVKLDEDATEYKWATLTEVRKSDFIPGIIEEIEMVDKILRKR